MNGQNQKVKPRFKENETFLHKRAKEEIASWIKYKPELLNLKKPRIVLEEKVVMIGHIIFTPDITVYDLDLGLKYFIEVVYSSPITLEKLYAMDMYIRQHEWWHVEIIEISAQWIMRNVKIPDRLEYGQKYTF